MMKQSKTTVSDKKKIDAMDIYIIVDILAVIVGAYMMVRLYILTGEIPNTLCTCWYSFWGGEAGFLALIKSVKIKRLDNDIKTENEKLKEELKKQTLEALKEQEK